jgi:three-Cys-motif partner protein
MPPSPSTNPEFFGGAWSDLKLRALREYLNAYRLVLKKQHFRVVYIDAFAGAGVRAVVDPPSEPGLFVDTSKEEDDYRHGSPLIALEVDPPFHTLIFIESELASLERLREQVQTRGHGLRDIQYHHGDANAKLLEQIGRMNWDTHRAVAFLDPFAMDLKWETIRAIATTHAIDLWLLFPAMAVNRMLPRSGVIPHTWERKLNDFFGTDSWREAFYVPEPEDLFGETSVRKLDQIFELISAYVTERLKSVFVAVAPKPLILRNSSNTPIFLLCFACGNERGAGPALRIAKHIIRTKSS